MSLGQEALANAQRKHKGRVIEIPKETIKEIKELLSVEVSIRDIAIHFGLTEEQIRFVRSKMSINTSAVGSKPNRLKPNAHVAPTKTSEPSGTFYSVAVSKKSYDYISSLKHLGVVPTRAKVMEIIVEHIKNDKTFLKKLIK
tara:strand:- start:8536 stop:8961 length:426 start_codon:yes stop_codon:yes gene_type:complete